MLLRILLFLLFPAFAQSQSIYKTPSGAKYHLATCRTVKNVSEEISIAKQKNWDYSLVKYVIRKTFMRAVRLQLKSRPEKVIRQYNVKG